MQTEKQDALLTPEENRRMFDEIMPRYDLLNDVLSLGLDRLWRRRAVRALAPVNGGYYLDAGCGTGDMCAAVLRRAPGARTLGIDASQAMLERAREKLRRQGRNGAAQFEVGDVCALGCRDAEFDGVVSGFCIRNVTDRAAALRELQRVTRPGGRIVLLELTRPKNGFIRFCHRFYGRHVVRPVGALLSRRRAYHYLTDSIEAFPNPETIVAEMARTGLGRISATPLSGGTVTLFSAQRCAAERHVEGGARP